MTDKRHLMCKIIWLDEAGSTNSVLADLARTGKADDGTVLAARCQSAGRGQRGNSWESAPGLNLTFSVLFAGRDIDVSQHFYVSEAVALAVADCIAEELVSADELVSVKWPNDIYVGDRKICGILIENVLNGRRVLRSIAGVGVNVNQRIWLSDAPNPMSLWEIDNVERDLDALLDKIVSRIMRYVDEKDDIPPRYMEKLWRKEGFHAYDDKLTGERIEARISDVLPSGHLVLGLRSGELREYAFKEVSAVI